jgi:hypothetical protein
MNDRLSKLIEEVQRIVEHDYNPEDDYELDEHPDPKVKAIVNKVTSDIKKALPKYKVFSDFTVAYITSESAGDAIAMFASGTSSKPVILFNTAGVYHYVKKFGVNLHTEVAMTLWHEIGHAIQEARGLDFDEQDAEDFADSHVYEFGSDDPFVLKRNKR